jgi:POT family proton-dependent oligopeptide transporter
VSKLVPAAWIGIMFGVYYLFIGMGNKPGLMGGMIETITAQYSLSTFQFYNSSIGAGLIMIPLSPLS